MTPRKKPAADRGADRGGSAVAGPPTGPDGKPLSFEKALARLEAIVEQLEDGKLTLEDSIARFEEGVGISRFLEGELARAEKRVQELVESGGAVTTRPWDGDEVGDESADESADEDDTGNDADDDAR